jgi:hypothetical protein
MVLDKRRLRSLGRFAAAVVLLAVGAPPAAGDTDGAAAARGAFTTQEGDCFETSDRRPVSLEQVRAYVPQRYDVRSSVITAGPPVWLGQPGALVADVGFTDYVCASLAVDGHAPRPTIVSLGTVAVNRDGQAATLILWFGTDNPILFARLRQLGADVHFIPRSTYDETVDAAGRRQIAVRYVDDGPGGLDYDRTITLIDRVTTPPGNVPRTSTGRFWHLGSRGELSVVFENAFEPNWTASVCFHVEPDSLPARYGITDIANPGSCFPGPRTFAQGSWRGTYTLLEP